MPQRMNPVTQCTLISKQRNRLLHNLYRNCCIDCHRFILPYSNNNCIFIAPDSYKDFTSFFFFLIKTVRVFGLWSGSWCTTSRPQTPHLLTWQCSSALLLFLLLNDLDKTMGYIHLLKHVRHDVYLRGEWKSTPTSSLLDFNTVNKETSGMNMFKFRLWHLAVICRSEMCHSSGCDAYFSQHNKVMFFKSKPKGLS